MFGKKKKEVKRNSSYEQIIAQAQANLRKANCLSNEMLQMSYDFTSSTKKVKL